MRQNTPFLKQPTMRKFRNFILLLLLTSSVISCSVREGLKEEEILALDRTEWQYSFIVLDPYLKLPIEGVKVELTLSGEVKSFTTGTNGTVTFNGDYVESTRVRLSKAGYIELAKELYFYGDDRSKILNVQVNMFPSGDENTITMKGKMLIQSDLTTREEEAAVDGSIQIDFYPYYGFYKTFTVKPDDNGDYEIKLPSLNNDVYGYFRISYPEFTIQQRLAINRLSGEPSFPATLPSVVELDTRFSPTSSFVFIPTVNPVYATIPAPENVGTQAPPFNSISINGVTGALITGNFSYSSTNSGYTAGDKPLTIVSIVGGSGATGVIRDTNANGILDQYEITNGGVNYPKSGNANAYTNGEKYGFNATFSNNTYLYYYNSTPSLRAGSILVNNVTFGTGYTRDQDVN